MKDRLKARIKATGKIVEVAPKRKRFDFDPDEFVDLNATDLEGNYVKFYFLDELEPIIENPPQPEATIRGWVARDQSMSFADKGNLTLFAEKPMRDYYDYNDLTYGFWSDNEKPTIPLSVDLFPSLTWQDEPIEVEITIKLKKL